MVSAAAVRVDLGNGRYLFALINGAESVGLEIFGGAKHPPLSLPRGKFVDAARTLVASTGEARALSRQSFPLLVTFDDINDPKSVRRVSPSDFVASFGAGYQLTAITMSIADEPVTEGELEKVLNWLTAYPERGLSPPTGRTTNIPFSRRVFHGDFLRE